MRDREPRQVLQAGELPRRLHVDAGPPAIIEVVDVGALVPTISRLEVDLPVDRDVGPLDQLPQAAAFGAVGGVDPLAHPSAVVVGFPRRAGRVAMSFAPPPRPARAPPA